LIRKPAVSGIFYQDNSLGLRNQIEQIFSHNQGPGVIPAVPEHNLTKSYGLILPHAGYIYSGPVAAWGMQEAAKKGIPETVIIIGPSHTGMGMPVSVWDKGSWETPFGEVQVDEELAFEFLKNYDYANSNYNAHLGEHSIEVHLPLLQFTLGNSFKILPISMMDQRKQTAEEIAGVFSKIKDMKKCIFIASTDLNHYETENITQKKDKEVIDAILNTNIERMYSVITEKNISMCGFGPVASLLKAKLGNPLLLKHLTSGQVSGDLSHVVGYSSFLID